jgi:general secretion pathway protein D
MTRNNRRRRARNTLLAILAAHFAATHPNLSVPRPTTGTVFAQDGGVSQAFTPDGWAQPGLTQPGWDTGAFSQPFGNPSQDTMPGMPRSGPGLPLPGDSDAGVVNTVQMPSAFLSKVSTSLEMKYRDFPGVQVSPDVRGGRLVILAPAGMQRQIQSEAMQIYVAESQPGASGTGVSQALAAASPGGIAGGVRTAGGSMQVRLATIGWQDFEDSLQRVVGKRMPVTTSQNGERSMYQLTGAPLDGTTIEVNRRENMVTVVAPEPAMPGWQKMIRSIDRGMANPGDVIEMIRIENAKPAPIQRALRLIDNLPDGQAATIVPTRNGGAPFRAAAFQQPPGAFQTDEDEAEVVSARRGPARPAPATRPAGARRRGVRHHRRHANPVRS